jgi:hypothetical protein
MDIRNISLIKMLKYIAVKEKITIFDKNLHHGYTSTKKTNRAR